MGYSRRLALIEKHTPMVRKTVGAFVNRYPCTAFLLDDLNSAADLALVLAVKKYMARKVHNIPAYLRYYLQNALWTEVRASNAIKTPRGKSMHRVGLSEVPEYACGYEHESIDADLVQKIANACHDDTDRLIVALLSTGLTLTAVADELGITQPTVTRRRSAIRRRLEGLQ